MVVGVSLVQENATKFPALSQPPQLLCVTGLTAIYVNTIFKNRKMGARRVFSFVVPHRSV